jgi:hypothetical protein
MYRSYALSRLGLILPGIKAPHRQLRDRGRLPASEMSGQADGPGA